MSGRTGPFWDGVAGRAPVPRAAATLGFEFLDADVGSGTIEVAFAAMFHATDDRFSRAELQRSADEGTRVFLAGYGVR